MSLLLSLASTTHLKSLVLVLSSVLCKLHSVLCSLPLSDRCRYTGTSPPVATIREPSESATTPHTHSVNIIAKSSNTILTLIFLALSTPHLCDQLRLM